MSSAIAQSGVMLGRLLQRPAQGFARCSRTQYLRLRAQQPVMMRIGFAVSAKAWEKKYTEDHEWIDTSDPENGTLRASPARLLNRLTERAT
jgi:glycine cleavage system H protein